MNEAVQRRWAALRRLGAPGTWTPAEVVFGLLVLGGLLLRVLALRAVRPINYGLFDSGTYLSGAVGDRAGGLFYDIHHPVGYSVWLRVIGWIISSGTQLAVIQHALGMLAGVLLWFALRRIGIPWVLAAVGSAAILINLEVIQLEHSIMSEAVYIPVLVGAFVAAAYAATTHGKRSLALAVGAGLLGGIAYTARYPGLLWLPVVALLPLFIAPLSEWRTGVVRAVAIGLGGLAVLVPYLAAQNSATGLGITVFPGAGWNAYSSVAPFADCKLFKPPAGTRKLCDKTPVAKRPRQAEYYTFGGDSPATKLEPRGYPYSDDKFAAFAAAAGPSVARYTKPKTGLGARIDKYTDAAENYTEHSTALTPIAARNPPQEVYEATLPGTLFDLAPMGVGSSANTFDDVKGVLRVHGWWIITGGILTLIAVLYARRLRLASLACWVFVVGNWIAAGGYNARYAVPVGVVAVLATVFAITGIVSRARGTRGAEPSGSVAPTGGW